MNQKEERPIFITIDGIDGVGKSTQLIRLTEFLQRLGRQVITVRDPAVSYTHLTLPTIYSV